VDSVARKATPNKHATATQLIATLDIKPIMHKLNPVEVEDVAMELVAEEDVEGIVPPSSVSSVAVRIH